MVLDSNGKLVMESLLETKAATILQFVHGLRGGTLSDAEKTDFTRILALDTFREGWLNFYK